MFILSRFNGALIENTRDKKFYGVVLLENWIRGIESIRMYTELNTVSDWLQLRLVGWFTIFDGFEGARF